MAEEQSPLRSKSFVPPTHKNTVAEGSGGTGERHMINMKSHPSNTKTGHIHHFKEHGHMGGSSHQFPGRRK
jgi:hypothetical protein